MTNEEIIAKICEKKEFSMLPREDIERAFSKFERRETSGEDKVKLTRELLRKVFSGVAGKKLLNWDDKSAEEVLKKHLSTRERYEHYSEIYLRLLKNLPKEISILDLGAGVNGMSYHFFEDAGKKVEYYGIEAVGQLVDMVNGYFEKEKIDGKMIHASLFELGKLREIANSTKKPRVVFLFKTVDALEAVERDYTKKLLEEIVPLVDRVIVSFPTESWMRRKKFFVQRTWLIDFVRERWNFIDDFNLGGERYLVFENGEKRNSLEK